MKINFKYLYPHIIIFFISLLVGLSFPSSPFTKNNLPMMDSSVFYYIGQTIYNGGTLYIDATDQKGPVIFFINYFAVMLANKNYIGLWLLEILCYYIFLLSQYKISKLLNIKPFLFLISMFSITISLPFLLDASGNAVEYWALPFISWSLYIFCLYYIKDNKIYFLNYFISGVLFSLTALLRVNQVTLWLGFAIIVIVTFIYKKNFLDLTKLSIYFVLGILAGIMPFLIYHIKTNSLTQAIHQSIILNLEYRKTKYLSSVSELLTYLAKILINSNFIIFIAIYILILLILYKKKKLENKLLHLSVIFSTILTLLVISISGRIYPHYTVLLLPLIAFMLMFATHYIYIYIEREREREVHTVRLITTILCIFIILLPNSIKVTKQIIIQNMPVDSFKIPIINKTVSKKRYTHKYEEYEYIGTYIKNNTNKEDLIYTQRPEIYLVAERNSITRYFSLPYMYIRKDSEVYKEFFEDLYKHKPKFIAINKQPHRFNIFENVRKTLNEYIEAEYTEVYSGENMILYKRGK